MFFPVLCVKLSLSLKVEGAPPVQGVKRSLNRTLKGGCAPSMVNVQELYYTSETKKTQQPIHAPKCDECRGGAIRSLDRTLSAGLPTVTGGLDRYPTLILCYSPNTLYRSLFQFVSPIFVRCNGIGSPNGVKSINEC